MHNATMFLKDKCVVSGRFIQHRTPGNGDEPVRPDNQSDRFFRRTKLRKFFFKLRKKYLGQIISPDVLSQDLARSVMRRHSLDLSWEICSRLRAYISSFMYTFEFV